MDFLAKELYTFDRVVTLASLLESIGSILAIYVLHKLFARFLRNRVLPRRQWEPDSGFGFLVTRASGIAFIIFGGFSALILLGASAHTIYEIVNFPIYSIRKVPVNLISVFVFGAVILLTIAVFQHAPKFLSGRVYPRFGLSPGVEYTLTRLVQYAVVVIGVLFSLNFLGVDLRGLTLFAGFLSVGIGFGLQNIVSNFISGVILLFERPIQVGDRIQVGDTIGDVRSIRIRSTVVRTLDNISILVPNSDLLTDKVTNWTFAERKVRLHISVGVAYGSDVDLVRNCLLKVAEEHSEVLADPVPEVYFLEFGDSSLNFDLLAWIPDPVEQPRIQSELHFAVDRAFRENGIVIPFPQRDLHLHDAPQIEVRRAPSAPEAQ